MSRCIPIVLLFALFVQCSPLRACGWEKLTVGSNCHERPDGPCATEGNVELAAHHQAADGQHCICDISKPEAPRGGVASAQFAAPIAPELAIAIIVTPPTLFCPIERSVPELRSRPSESYHLPLLF